MAWCLPKQHADRFKNALRSGDIDPMSLAEMSSAERRAVFEKHLGADHAENINAQFESKLLLKNRQMGYVSWAKKMLGENTPAGRDIISRVGRMEKLLSPAEEKAFLSDLAAQKLGTRVSMEEATKIAELSKKVGESKEAWQQGKIDRLDHGADLVSLRNYVGDLTARAERPNFRHRPIGSTVRTAWEGIKLSKGLKAAWDISMLYRPGNRVMFRNPTIWARHALGSFKNLWRTYGGKEVLDMQDADLLTRENALNGNYRKAKLDIGVTEEAFPTDVPSQAFGYIGKKIEQTRIPIASKVAGRIVGKTYKASQDLYSAFVRGTRADTFDAELKIAKKMGYEIDDDFLKNTGRMVNSLGGRGRLGSLETAGEFTNIAMFSPKMTKSHLDVLFDPVTGGATVKELMMGQNTGSNFVRRRAALSLVKIIGGTAAMLVIAKALKPDSVTFDPTNANFGKVKVGNTRFDLTAGSGSIAILASRLAQMKMTSSTTGKVTKLNERDKAGKLKFGVKTAKDLVYDFFENKEAPIASVMSDILEGQTRAGEKPTVMTTLRDLYEPMPSANYRELKNDPNSAPILAAMIADAVGVATNTYAPKKKKRTR